MCFEECIFDGTSPVGSAPTFPKLPPKATTPAVAAKVAALAVQQELLMYKAGSTAAEVEAATPAPLPSMASVVEKVYQHLQATFEEKYEGVWIKRVDETGVRILIRSSKHSGGVEIENVMEKEIYLKATVEGAAVNRIIGIVSVYEYQLLGEEYQSIADEIGVTYHDNRKHLVLHTYEGCLALVHEVLQARVCGGRELDEEERKEAVAGRVGPASVRWLGGKQSCRMVRLAMACEMKDQNKPLPGGQGKGPLKLDPGVYGLYEQKERDGVPGLFFRSAECSLLIRGDDKKLVKVGDKKDMHCKPCKEIYRSVIRKRLERKKRVGELEEVDYYELANLRSRQEDVLREKLGDKSKEMKKIKRRLKKLTKMYREWQAERRNVRVEMTDGSLVTLVKAMKQKMLEQLDKDYADKPAEKELVYALVSADIDAINTGTNSNGDYRGKMHTVDPLVLKYAIITFQKLGKKEYEKLKCVHKGLPSLSTVQKFRTTFKLHASGVNEEMLELMHGLRLKRKIEGGDWGGCGMLSFDGMILVEDVIYNARTKRIVGLSGVDDNPIMAEARRMLDAGKSDREKLISHAASSWQEIRWTSLGTPDFSFPVYQCLTHALGAAEMDLILTEVMTTVMLVTGLDTVLVV
jgi:hypothetical protein